jgi:hypothetical protein
LDLGTEKNLKSECAENELLVTYFWQGGATRKEYFVSENADSETIS